LLDLQGFKLMEPMNCSLPMEVPDVNFEAFKAVMSQVIF